MMSPETRAWLKRLDKLGDQAKARIAAGQTPRVAINAMANASVEPPGSINCERIAADLHMYPTPGATGGMRFAAEMQLFVFSRSVIGELAES
jgi:hypothetical protein